MEHTRKKLIAMFALFGTLILSFIACSNDYNDTEFLNRSTRATEEEEDTTTKVTIPDVPDETGAAPYIMLYSIDEEDTVVVTTGGSQTTQAPVELNLFANIGNPDGYKYICEWKLWSTKDGAGEEKPLVTRFEENTTYTLTQSGGYNAKLYVTFTQGTDTIEYESEVIGIVISESQLTCPDAFTPNNDSINDTYRITSQSIIKLDAKFFNRWGDRVHTATLDNAQHVEGEPNKLVLWDGKYNGKIVDNGVYYMNLEALGSDGRKYKIKKAISVTKGFREGTESSSGGSSSDGGGGGGVSM